MMWTLENCFVQEVSKGLSTSNFIEFFFKKKIHFEFSSNLNFMCIFTTATASVLTVDVLHLYLNFVFHLKY